MFEKKILLRAIMAATLASGLTACGGGSSSSTSSETPADSPDGSTQTSTGQFVDSPVSGLEYSAQPSGTAGITDDDGYFQYVEGDEITFSVGAFNLGKASGGSVITPVELTGDVADKTSNIARFLQTLDDDGVPGNGITITASTRETATNQNPTDVADADLGNSTLADTIIGLTSENTVPQTTIVSTEDATDHLSGTLDQLEPIESCLDERAVAVTEDRLADKVFGFIRADEQGIFHFLPDGTLAEFSYDSQRTVVLRDGAQDTWALLNGGTEIQFGREDSPLTACATDNSLIFELGDEIARFYDIKAFALPSSSQSFLIGEAPMDPKAILTVNPDGSLGYFPTETPISENSKATVATSGVLNLDFDEGDVIDKIFFLAGQSNRIGVHLDYSETGSLLHVGTAEMIANASSVAEEALKGSVRVFHDAESNETVILRFNGDYTLEDFANDYYSGETQETYYSKGSWSLQGDKLTMTDDQQMQEVFQVLDAGTATYFATPGTEEENLYKLRKTQAITESAFLGTYTVSVPTENTVERELVVQANGVCTYSGTDCTWTIDATGKAELNFGSNETGTVEIWQLAGSNDQFAHLITHSNDVTDIEPGFMTRN
ncbi:hypothetical protein SAMN05216203_1558 [Marinobacter daqiaonensis]|uniref:Uncharacterized protein n=1 Tax=Marinobacter daqiaonensis TaxID=650891 RepID=A0A1I6HUA8_9GAMM|nr:hypothetical protein [Marinobacter daqiaonensis]SFR58052.1 hypothetical protein SAMN05216203_1558 [Marinobacter daqiaonensis]